jgi:hypothetical protein
MISDNGGGIADTIIPVDELQCFVDDIIYSVLYRVTRRAELQFT